MSEQSVEEPRCVLCREPIGKGAVTCTKCGAYQDGKHCRSCGRWIPRAARRCGECNTYQDLRGIIPGSEVVLACLGTVLALLGSMSVGVVNFLNRPSRTTAVMLPSVRDEKVDPYKDVLVARATNRGRLPSIIHAVTLDLSSVNAEKADLTITNFEGEIPGEGSFNLKLYTDTIRPKTSKPDLAQRLCAAEALVKLQFDVEESDVWGNMKRRKKPLEIDIPAPRIRPWIIDQLGDKYDPC